jgi:hypothetical protein
LPLQRCGERSSAGIRHIGFASGFRRQPALAERAVGRRLPRRCSLEKLAAIEALAADCGIGMEPWHCGDLSIVPLLGWYDYSFGAPSAQLRESWMDYRACAWPVALDENAIAAYFSARNTPALATRNRTVISFSHFLPRIDVMPHYIPATARLLYPVLGSSRLEAQVRALRPVIHVYGHSHVNRNIEIDGVRYINNAFGYPSERLIARQGLRCIYEQ